MRDVYEVVRDIVIDGKPLGIEAAANIVLTINQAGYVIAPANAVEIHHAPSPVSLAPRFKPPAHR